MKTRKGFVVWRTLFVVCFFTALSLVSVQFFQAEAANEIKIGILGPIKFHFGQYMWNAAVLTSEEINETGGINAGPTNYKIKLIQYDTNELASIPDAVSAMERAINIDDCDVVMGGARTEAVLAMQEVAAEYKKLYIDTGSASMPLIERVKESYDDYKYYFRTAKMATTPLWCYSYSDADYVGRAIKKRLGIPKVKVALILDKAAFTEGWAEMGRNLFPKMGYELVGVWRTAYMSTNLFAEASAIKESGAQLIYAVLVGPGGSAFTSAWGKLKIPAAVAGTITVAQQQSFWKDSGGAVNYLSGYSSIGRVGMSERTIPFFDKYSKRFGNAPGWGSPFIDGALLALKQAIEKAGSLDADKLVPAMEGVDVMAANGRLKFYPNDSEYPHQADERLRTLVSFQWRDGKMYWYYPCAGPVHPALVEAYPPIKVLESVEYEGTADYELPPWMVRYYEK